MSVSTLQGLLRQKCFANNRAIVLPPDDDNPKTVEVTYSQASQQVDKIAETLVRAGVCPGDKVAIVLANGLEFIISFLAAASVRAVACPFNPNYKKDEFLFYMGDTEPKILILPVNRSSVNAEAAEAAARERGVPIWQISNGSGEVNLIPLTSERLPTCPHEEAQPEDVCLILHTSGTTSRPKAVPLRHRNIVGNLHNISSTYHLTPQDTAYLVMPLFHVHGLIGVLLSSLLSGATVVVPPKFSASRFWKHFIGYRCSWYSAVPTIHQMLLLNVERDYNTLSKEELRIKNERHRFTRSCSAALPALVMAKLETTFGAPIIEAYAMTEASHQMCSNPLPPRRHKAGSVGIGQGLEVVILNNKNEILRQGETGEISIRGPNVTDGYLNNEEANKKCFSYVKQRDVIFFRTGDQGKFDRDGYLALTGRLKEFINRAGEKISPLEIDDVLLSHGDVNFAVAFGVPDPLYGQEVWAAVIPKKHVTDRDKMSKDIKTYCESKLPKFKCPKVIFVAEDVPRTATGKIQRRFVSSHFFELSKQTRSKL